MPYTVIISIQIEVYFGNSVKRGTEGRNDQINDNSRINCADFDCHLLDVFIMLAELFIVETKLIHKVGSHLLDLVIRESLRWGRQD